MQVDPTIGKVIGNYRVLSFLGEGGMATVYRAEHSTIGKEAALKLLKPEYSSRPQSVARFFHEAQAVNRIRHENLVDIFDFGQSGNGEHYILMELLHGEALTESLKDKKPLPVERIIRIGTQICSALEAAHQKGIVHRDLKDANVFLTTRAGQKDFVKILDFGIAKLLDGQTPEVIKTKSGAMIGTPLYISPEQARGSAVGPGTDIYALGCLLYCMATGEPPFYDDNAVAVALKHVDEKPIPPKERNPSLPAKLNTMILRCLEKEPSARYPSMAAAGKALDEVLTGSSKEAPYEAVVPVETERLVRAKKVRPASPMRSGLLIGGVLALVASGVIGYQVFSQKAEANPQPEVAGSNAAVVLTPIEKQKLEEPPPASLATTPQETPVAPPSEDPKAAEKEKTRPKSGEKDPKAKPAEETKTTETPTHTTKEEPKPEPKKEDPKDPKKAGEFPVDPFNEGGK